MTSKRPVFHFSLRSPYSWLAGHDLSTHYPKLLARLALIPFWEPDADNQAMLGAQGELFLYKPMSKEKHLYILSDIKRLARKRGLDVKWPVDKAPLWEVPHLAYFIAEAQGKGWAYIDAITRARWCDGRDICDPQTVADVGASLGLDPHAMRNAHQKAQLRNAGLAALHACIQNGVFGVPFFMLGRDKFWGIDRMPDFIAAVANAGPQDEPTEYVLKADSGKAYEPVFDHAGGCG